MSVEQKTTRILHRSADRYLSGTPNVKNGVDALHENPTPLALRLEEFQNVLPVLTQVILDPNIDRDNYYMANYLGMELDGKPMPIPSDIVSSKDRSLNKIAKDTFLSIDEKIKNGSWEFPSVVINQGMLISGLLIEGYGEFLAQLYNNPELSRAFVVGFEEVLWHKFQGSQILKDVLPWMIEEKNDFSYNVKRALEKLDPTYIKRHATNDAPFVHLLTDQRVMNSPFGPYALAAAIREDQEKMKSRWGNDWEGALITPLSMFIHETGIALQDNPNTELGLVKSLFIIGYELKDYDKLGMFIEEIGMYTVESLNPSAIATPDKLRTTALHLISFIQQGMNTAQMSNPDGKLNFDRKKIIHLAARLAVTIDMLKER